MATPVTIEALSGVQLRDMFAAAAGWLEKHAESVNAINVFPVPDGDTGTNMFLTMRSIMEEAQRCQEEDAGTMMAAMARGALMGARGNSGVILSQIIRGMARAMDGAESVDAAGWVRGMEEGSAGAYKAVTKPVEGTILTVMRESAVAARQALDAAAGDIVAVLEAIVEEATQSLERTPTLLPVLAEAGVVDAGGKGLLVLLDGMTRHLKGEPMEAAVAPPEEHVGREWLAVTSQLHEHDESLYGYCTEFLIGGQEMEPDSVRNRMLELGDSVLVVGDDRLVRVHVHTDDPGAALSHGTHTGSLLQVKVDNIRQQADRFLEMHEVQAAVAAQQGQELTKKRLRVVETRSVAQGIAALLALNQDEELEANLAAMEEARQGVRTIEVCRAVRSRSVRGVKVREGQIIAIVDDELRLAAETAEEGVLRALEGVEAQGASLVTLYYGADTKQEDAESLSGRLREAFPGYDVEVVYGGQPHYNYIVSLE